ncbi:MAG: hypothetical protein Q4E73_09885 [Lachnospiraceae bacterium]|nr:hypothetical protein [Lachnospiraceae bacterium]
MNQYIRRLSELEQKRLERLKTPIVIVTLMNSGEYEYKGKLYSKEQFDALMEKVQPNTIILNDIPREE